MVHTWGTCLLAMLIVIVILLAFQMGVAESSMTGFWKADANFLKRSGLRSMVLYIAPASGFSRRGYLIMQKTNDEYIYNGEIDLQCSPWSFPRRMWDSTLRLLGYSDFSFSGDFITYAEHGNPQIPQQVDVIINTLDQTLSVSSGGQLYGFFFKDAEATDGL